MPENQEEKISTIQNRIRDYIKYKEIDVKSFERISGLSNGFVSKIGDSIREASLSKIQKSFPLININWLKTGIGPMELNETDTKSLQIEGKRVPFYDSDVTASIVGSFSDIQETPSFYVDFKPFNDCDAYFRVYGDSMYPKYGNGEVVSVKRIYNMDSILWGESYLVLTDVEYDNLKTIKSLHPHDKDEGKIVLRASNPNFKGDTIIKKSSIIGLFLVKGKIRIEHL